MAHFFFQAEDGIRDLTVTGVQTCALPIYFDTLEALDLVTRLDVVVGLHRDTAFGTVADFLDVFLEAAQRFQLAFEDHHAVAQYADRLVALDHALDDHRTGDGAQLGTAEDVADLGDTDDLFTDLHAQQTGSHLLHLIDHVIDDREVTQVHAIGFDDATGRSIRTHVEADDGGLRSGRRVGVRFSDAAHAGVDNVDADVFVGQRDQCLAEGLHRTLHVGLDDQVEDLLALALAQGRHDVFHAAAGGGDQARFTALGLTLLGNVLGQALVLDDHEVVTGFRHAGQAQDLHRDGRAGELRLLAGFVEQRTHAAVLDAAHQVVSLLQAALLHQHGGDRAAALVQRRFDHHARGAAFVD